MYFIIKNSILQLTDVVKIAVEWKLNYLKDVYDIKNIERDYNHVD